MLSIAQMLTPLVHDLSRDPDTVCRLNVNTFQQSALTSFRAYQYCTFYQAHSETVRFVILGRREIKYGAAWELLELNDYGQTTDDGHNTISIGICHGDGTIHMSFDHHSNDLNYRVSAKGLASNPERFEWKSSLFSPVLSRLDRDPRSTSLPMLSSVTYPRFINIGDGLLFECRVGRAGAGSDVLYSYDLQRGRFNLIGTYLVGIKSNPYPNGLTYDPTRRRLHVSWTNRHFTDYDGAHDPDSTAHQTQAGPNGPENNENLCYAFSDNGGHTWCLPASRGPIIDTSHMIIGTDPSAIAISIPRDSGIMNQEAQCTDARGGFHVLNRDDRDEGVEKWKHYHLSDGRWKTTALPFRQPTKLSARGKLIYCLETDAIYFLLPSAGNGSGDGLTILRAPRQEDGLFLSGHDIVWIGEECDGEVLVDELAVKELGILYILTTRKMRSERRVVILEFLLRDLGRCPRI